MRSATRSIPRFLALAMALAASALASAAPADAAIGGSLSQLPGPAGCIKGTGGHSWIHCQGTVRGLYDVSSVAISPDGRFAYGVSLESGFTKNPDGTITDIPGGTIVVFARDATTGALTQLGGPAGCIRDVNAPMNSVTEQCWTTANGLRGAKMITLSPDGRFAYVASMESDAIAAFARDPQTGALTQLPGAAGCVKEVSAGYTKCGITTLGLHGVRWLSISPDGRNLYASAPTSDDIVEFARNTATGALTPLSGANSCVEDKLARVKKCPSIGVGLNYPRSLTVSPDGRNVYVASDSADSTFPGDVADGNAVAVFTRDPSTGALHQLPGADACTKDTHARGYTPCSRVGQGLFKAFEVVITSDGRFAYVASSGGGSVGIFSRDPRTGALTQVSGPAACIGAYGCTPAAAIKGANGITLSNDERYAYVSGFDSRAIAVFSRNATTGRLTQLPSPASCTRDVSAGNDLAPCATTILGLNGPRKLTLSPDGKNAYVPSSPGSTISVFNVAPSDGPLNTPAPTAPATAQAPTPAVHASAPTITPSGKVTVQLANQRPTSVKVTIRTSARARHKRHCGATSVRVSGRGRVVARLRLRHSCRRLARRRATTVRVQIVTHGAHGHSARRSLKVKLRRRHS